MSDDTDGMSNADDTEKPAEKSAPKKKSKAKQPQSNGGAGKRLRPDSMAVNERRILQALAASEGPLRISDIAAKYRRFGVSPTKDVKKGSPVSAYRNVVNALRRLRPRGLVKYETRKGERGHLYALTAAGKKFHAAMGAVADE